MTASKDYLAHESKFNIPADWHSNFKREWTDEEIQAHIIKEVGFDILRPTKYFIYGKLYKMDNGDSNFGATPDEIIKDVLEQSVCKILAYGPDAFKDSERFPKGQNAFIGQWYRFDKYEHRKFKVGGEYVVLFPDVAIEAHICDPYYIDSLFLTPYI